MRKLVKRLTAVMLSLAMVFTCALQTGAAEGQSLSKIVLKNGTNWADDYGISYNQDTYGTDYAADGYKVEKQTSGDIWITPAGESFGRKSFSFSVMKETGETVTLSAEGLSDGTGIDEIVERSTEYGRRIRYDLIAYAGIMTENGTLTLSAQVTPAPLNVTFRTEGTGFDIFNSKEEMITGSDTAESGREYSFSVKVYSNKADSEPYVLVDGASLSATKSEADGDATKYSYKTSQLSQDTVIQVSLQKKQVSVHFLQLNPQGYTTTAVNKTLDYGSDYSFVVTPAEGYNAPQVLLLTNFNGKTTITSSGGNYTLNNIVGSALVLIGGSASAIKNSLIFNPTDGVEFLDSAGKSIGDGISPVPYGEDFKFKVRLEEGYTQSKPVVTVGGKVITADSGPVDNNTYTYTAKNITSETIVNVTGVTLNTYKITLTKGEGYTLSSNQDTVRYDETFTFRATVDAKYAANFSESDINVKGTSQADATVTSNKDTGEYQISNVKDNLTVSVNLPAAAKFSVTFPSGDGYTCDLAEPASGVEYGSTVSFKLTPKNGYQITSVSYTMGGTTIPLTPVGDGQYIINNVTADITDINVTVREVVYTVTFIESRAKDATKRTRTETYTVSRHGGLTYDKGEGKLTLPQPDKDNTSIRYLFNGWYANGEEKTEIIFGNTDAFITLEAVYGLNYDRLFDVTLESTWNTGDTYTLRLAAAWFADDLDEFKDLDIKVEDCGFFMATSEFTLNDEYMKKCIDSIQNYNRQLMLIDKNKRIYMFNFGEGSYSLNGTFTQAFGGISSQVEGRYVIAYVHVTINGGSYYYFSGQNDDVGDHQYESEYIPVKA